MSSPTTTQQHRARRHKLVAAEIPVAAVDTVTVAQGLAADDPAGHARSLHDSKVAR